MTKSTHYHYRKTRPAQGQEAFIVRAEETEEEWKDRLRVFGISDEQIDIFTGITSLEAFVNYCRDEGLEESYIPGSRILTNAE